MGIVFSFVWAATAALWFMIGYFHGRKEGPSPKKDPPVFSIRGNRNNLMGTLTFKQLKELINEIRSPMLEDERFTRFPRLSKVEGKDAPDAWRLDFVDKVQDKPSQTIDIDADNPCWEMFIFALISVNCYKK
jgi:hypothetical protein